MKKKNLGRHYIWLRKSFYTVLRILWEGEDGGLYIRYNGKLREVEKCNYGSQYELEANI